MRFRCPRCATVVEAQGGQPMVCPTCRFAGNIPAPPRPAQAATAGFSGPYGRAYPPRPAATGHAYGQAYGHTAPQGHPAWARPELPTSPKAVAALACGIAAFVIWILPFVGPFVATGLSVTALVLGSLAMGETSPEGGRQGRGMAVAGVVLGIVGLVIGLIVIGLVLAFGVW